MMLRREERMRNLFGVKTGKVCGECSHLHRIVYHDRVYFKCDVYGLSSCAATDWRKKYTACGLFNKPYTGKAISCIPQPKEPEIDIISGQTTFADFLEPICDDGGEDNATD